MAAPHQPAGYGWTGTPPDPTAVIGRRIGALLIDAVIAIAIVVPLGMAFADRTDVQGALRDHDCRIAHDAFGDPQLRCNGFQLGNDDDVRILDSGPALAISAGAGLLVFVLVPVLAGASIGKHATGLRVVDAAGGPANAGRHLLRWLLFLVDGPFTLGICGLFTALLSKGHRRVGDMVAGTYVVGKASIGRPVDPAEGERYAPPPGFAAPPGGSAPAPPPPVASPG